MHRLHALCEPECPVEAIYSEEELPAGQEQFKRLNAELAESLASDHREEGRTAGCQGVGRQARKGRAARALEPRPEAP